MKDLIQIEHLGPFQAEVLSAVWELEWATVHQTIEKLQEGRGPIAYTSVLSTLQKLEKAGLVTHRKEGQRHAYHATISRDTAIHEAIKRLTKRIFGGSIVELIRHIIDVEGISTKDRRIALEIIKRKAATV